MATTISPQNDVLTMCFILAHIALSDYIGFGALAHACDFLLFVSCDCNSVYVCVWVGGQGVDLWYCS